MTAFEDAFTNSGKIGDIEQHIHQLESPIKAEDENVNNHLQLQQMEQHLGDLENQTKQQSWSTSIVISYVQILDQMCLLCGSLILKRIRQRQMRTTFGIMLC